MKVDEVPAVQVSHDRGDKQQPEKRSAKKKTATKIIESISTSVRGQGTQKSNKTSTTVLQVSDAKQVPQMLEKSSAVAGEVADKVQIRKSSRLATKASTMQPKSKQGAGPRNALVVPTRQAGKDDTSIKTSTESWSKRKHQKKRKDRISYFQGKTLRSLNLEGSEEEIDIEI